jgi:CxxC-x17-CxxC domain-containing protein
MADRMLTCRDCQNEFVFSEGEQEFYARKGLSTPSRCPDCRNARKRQRDNGGSSYSSGSYGGGGSFGGGGWSSRPEREQRDLQLHDVVCEECGTMTQVPFKPRGTRPVYCRDCYNNRR